MFCLKFAMRMTLQSSIQIRVLPNGLLGCYYNLKEGMPACIHIVNMRRH